MSSAVQQTHDTTLARLLSLYERDKDEFEKPSRRTKAEAAKLLRDTTENLLHYLRTRSDDARHSGPGSLSSAQIGEIERTLEQATEAAVSVYGRRKWEKSDVTGGKGGSRSTPRHTTMTGRSRSPMGRERRSSRDYSRERRERAAAEYKGRDRYRPRERYQSWRPS